MKDSKINDKQTELLLYLYRFRYLTIKQLQKLFNHQDSHRVKVWLNDLIERTYIYAIKDGKNPTKPYIFCLDTKSRLILKHYEGCDKNFLGRLYKEKSYSENFINHCLFIVDTYLYFRSQQEPETKLEFFTEQDLIGYDYFPQEKPDAYISLESKDGTDRYFLDIFDDYRKASFLPRKRIKDYISYCENGEWSVNTENTPLPMILFVLNNEKIKKHIFYYGKSIIEKSMENISLFLTTKESIRSANIDMNIWQIVSEEEL